MQNIEFYNSPKGEVIVSIDGNVGFALSPKNVDIVNMMYDHIKTHYRKHMQLLPDYTARQLLIRCTISTELLAVLHDATLANTTVLIRISTQMLYFTMKKYIVLFAVLAIANWRTSFASQM